MPKLYLHDNQVVRDFIPFTAFFYGEGFPENGMAGISCLSTGSEYFQLT
jgi:hypothetical protein